VILRPRGPIVGRRPAGCALTCYLLPAMLARLLNRPAPALAQVARFRGLAAGWQPAGAPRAAADAARLGGPVAADRPRRHPARHPGRLSFTPSPLPVT
jgi:hypothetical protein